MSAPNVCVVTVCESGGGWNVLGLGCKRSRGGVIVRCGWDVGPQQVVVVVDVGGFCGGRADPGSGGLVSAPLH